MGGTSSWGKASSSQASASGPRGNRCRGPSPGARAGTRTLTSRLVGRCSAAEPRPPSPRRLDANLISLVPEGSFEGLSCLRHLWLDDNALAEVPVRALSNLPGLQAMTLALNRIRHVPDLAFQNLSSLVVL